MRYTNGMQTKVGVHYHVSVGPEVVSRLNSQPLRGPHVDLVVSDYEEAVMTLELLVEGLPVGHLDDWDLEEIDDYMQQVEEAIRFGDIPYGELSMEENGFEINLGVCGECVPKGLN